MCRTLVACHVRGSNLASRTAAPAQRSGSASGGRPRRRPCATRGWGQCPPVLSGGGGNRTRVLQRFGESSPSAVAVGLSGDGGQRHPASCRSRLCVSPPPRRHGRRASPADDGTDARRTGAIGPNSQPEIRLRAPDRLDRRWRLYLFPALFRGSGDHGSLLSRQPSKSKPITPKAVAEPALCRPLRRHTTLAMGCSHQRARCPLSCRGRRRRCPGGCSTGAWPSRCAR